MFGMAKRSRRAQQSFTVKVIVAVVNMNTLFLRLQAKSTSNYGALGSTITQS
jgi:hypothetical protein